MREHTLAEVRIHHLTPRQIARDNFQIVTVHAKHLAGLTSSEAELTSCTARSFLTSSPRAR
jgi:hypothetical protein